MAVNVGDAGAVPRIGMVATVRNRRGMIGGVRPFDGPEGRLHLVDVEYNDGDAPHEETLLWEREPGARVIEATALPTLYGSAPMDPADFDALVRACRWSARLPFVDPDGEGPLTRMPICSPFFGAIQVEDYQLVPLLTALRMPRVTLLLADDVGLGKTVEAGLILTELILRRRIRRVLILTPASLRTQWRDEMWEKFSLPFEVVDRDATRRLRRQIGMDANPWRSHSRIVASYHYLKQPDVLEEFRSASRAAGDAVRLPWDMLIVDEAHNLAPSPLGEDSDVCATLREIAPLFEHRLFLTATPHNGFTASFTGLLEMLDPVRFTRSAKMTETVRRRVEEVVVRRLKSEINAACDPPRFAARRPPEGQKLNLGPAEAALSAAFASLREAIHRAIQGRDKEQAVGSFAVEILGKRLLSCPVAFAESWRRCRAGMEGADEVTDNEVFAAKRATEKETSDDREQESQNGAAAAAIGAWLRPLRQELDAPIAQVDAALARLGFNDSNAPIETDPTADARYEALRGLIQKSLMHEGRWLPDERLVIFTEYKTTLDYIVRRLTAETFCEEGRVATLFGGMDEEKRVNVKAAFNDPEAKVRVLVATDAASEGLNLQATARYLLHFDIPWNPARLEQRNGRLDRHGQAREVAVWYFVTEEDRDLKFLERIVQKVDTIHSDLGATGEVFDEATRRLVQGEDPALIEREIERRLAELRGVVDIPRVAAVAAGVASPAAVAGARPATISEVMAELDLGPEPMRTTLDTAMAIRVGRPRIQPPDYKGRCRIVEPPPPQWVPTIDETIRTKGDGERRRALAFDPASFVTTTTGFPVFRSRPDTALMHLGHPLFQRALSILSRQRFPGGDDGASRWTIRRGPIGSDADALLILTVEELAVNELREVFHHWVRSIRFPLIKGRLGVPLPHLPAAQLPSGNAPGLGADEVERARDLWLDVEDDLREYLVGLRGQLTDELLRQLGEEGRRAAREAREQFQSRSAELSRLITETTIAHLEREIEALKEDRAQGDLFRQDAKLLAIGRDLGAKEEELKRRQARTNALRSQLEVEGKRVRENLLPRRYAMRGEAQVLPVAVEVVLPEDAR